MPYRLFKPIVQETKQHIHNTLGTSTHYTWAKILIIISEVNAFSKKSSLNHSPSKYHLTFFRVLRLIFGRYGAPDQELFAQQIHKVLIDPPP